MLFHVGFVFFFLCLQNVFELATSDLFEKLKREFGVLLFCFEHFFTSLDCFINFSLHYIVDAVTPTRCIHPNRVIS